MPCYSPMSCFKTDSGEIVFSDRSGGRPLAVPCGRCVGCHLMRSRSWAARCLHEAQMHEHSCFITLTFNEDHVPSDGNLDYRFFQLFMKRLRKKFACYDVTLCQWVPRFYMCGEYGELGRPHFHACLFGVFFPDRKFHKNLSSGFKLYTSEILSSLWPFGFSSIGDVSFESAAYVARYVLKKVPNSVLRFNVESDTGEVFVRVPEFTHMSLKPGVGALWFHKFRSDVYPGDHVVVRGMKFKPPKYYDKLFERFDFDAFDHLKMLREQRGLEMSADSTPERLRVRESVALAGLRSKVRILE